MASGQETAEGERTACPSCSKTFKRLEHMQRHLATHSQGGGEHVCPVCRKAFVRKDVLSKHLQTHGNDASERRRQRVPAACSACITAKTKCDGDSPCKRCSERGSAAECVRVARRTSRASSSARPLQTMDAVATTSRLPSTEEEEDVDVPLQPDVSVNLDFLREDTLAPVVGFSRESTQAPPMVLPSVEPGYEFDFSWLLADSRNASPAPMGDSWLDFDLFAAASVFEGQPPGSTSAATSGPQVAVQSAPSAAALLYPSPSQDSGGNETARTDRTGPWAWNPVPQDNQISLSPLGEIAAAETLLSFGGAFSFESRDRLLGSLRWAALTSAEEQGLMDPLISVPLKTLDHFIGLYFANFDSLLPIVHRPTFSVATFHPFALAMMVAIGALYSGIAGAFDMAYVLSELADRSLRNSLFNNPVGIRLIGTQASFVLWAIVSRWQGSKRTLELAEAFRATWNTGVRKLGLLEPSEPPILSPLAGVEERWRSWAEWEQGKRVGLAAFLIESEVELHFNTRSMFSASELTGTLACELDAWEAPTAADWAASVARSSPANIAFPPCGSIPSCLKALSELRTPPDLPKDGTLAAFNLSILSSALAEQASQLHSLTKGGILAAKRLLVPLRQSIDLLLTFAPAYPDPVDPVPQNAAMYQAHCHLRLAQLRVSLPPDLVFGAAGVLGPSKVSPSIQQLTQRLSADPVAARRLLVAALECMKLARASSSSPSAGMVLFWSGVTLSVFALLAQEWAWSLELDEPASPPVVLDKATTAQAKAWVRTGGRAALSTIGSLEAGDAPRAIMGHVQTLLLETPGAWQNRAILGRWAGHLASPVTVWSV